MSWRWLLAPVGLIGVAVLVAVSVIPMMFSIAYGLPLIVLATSLGVLALARRHATPPAATTTRRWLTGAVAGLALIVGWLAIFERPCLAELPPVEGPAIVLLGVLAVAQLTCCVGMLWTAQVARPEWRPVAGLLMWAGPSLAGFAYEVHASGFCIGAM